MFCEAVRAKEDGSRKSGRLTSVAVFTALVAALTACTSNTTSGSGFPKSANEDGHIPDPGISPHSQHVAIRKMDPDLLAAVRKAAADARAAGVELKVTSG